MGESRADEPVYPGDTRACSYQPGCLVRILHTSTPRPTHCHAEELLAALSHTVAANHSAVTHAGIARINSIQL